MAFLWFKQWYQRARIAPPSSRDLTRWYSSAFHSFFSFKISVSFLSHCCVVAIGERQFKWFDRDAQLASIRQKHRQLLYLQQRPNNNQPKVSLGFLVTRKGNGSTNFYFD